ncbi:antiviral RADAR system adenosine triphosphatase RdrA [Serratia marcescens]|uniref:antiviral RADAR system adenosine triphosphatase RdrA n=1 Tax=Serratia marcescens TaxID=615 RepID=UPI003879EFA2
MNKIYIPLDCGESAVLKDPDTLLPRNIYEQLAQFIAKAVSEVPKPHEALNETRSHKAISIDGARGTGKTSVLVNLSDYLESNAQQLAGKIHILDPIDPTLLEDGESLFLHIIVAAVLHDKEIKEAQGRDHDKSRIFTHKLENLAHGLESVDLQQNQHGMDKIRSLYGSKHLANCVEAFLKSALDLIGKELLILPIDDVDTSLNRAFENLEILRRYLTSPYVLPIVSGDRDLYDEVCWRDFHGRLNKDSSYNRNKSYSIAKELAIEYQRKILPLPRRLSMPSVSDYWLQDGIDVTLDKDGIPLRNFMAWLKIFITGPVNGLEGSDLPLPIPSMRALTQFISHCSDLIYELPESFKNKTSTLGIRRMWQMPDVPIFVIERFAKEHQALRKEAKREYADAYKSFNDELKNSGLETGSSWLEEINESAWNYKLYEYFRFEPKAGVVFLTLQAKQYWSAWARGGYRNQSVLAATLFQPLQHDLRDYEIFEKNNDLSDWESQLKTRLPETWLSSIKGQRTLLPYPVAEVGVITSLKWKYWEEVQNYKFDNNVENKAFFLISILTQRNFFTNAKQSIVLNIGRVFELIITSLVSDIELADLQRIMQRSPFYSASALAPTKALYLDEIIPKKGTRLNNRFESERDLVDDLLEEVPDENEFLLKNLCDDINRWRKEHSVANMNISPWLVYKVFNKVYSQSNPGINGISHVESALNSAGWAFYATWSAFGSFEKGELFGLADVVSTTNINSVRNFYHHNNFHLNVGPFTPEQNQQSDSDREAYQHRKVYGEKTRTVSYVLGSHPLKKWIDEVLNAVYKQNQDPQPKNKPPVQVKDVSPARYFITEKLSLDPQARLVKTRIKKQFEMKYPGYDKARGFIGEVISKFPQNDPAVRTLLAAFSELYPDGE